MVEDFGQQLKQARIEAGFDTQAEAAGELKRRGRGVSQSLLAQYENDRVSDPNPAVLQTMADVYGQDYMTWIIHLAETKYRPKLDWEERDQMRWSFIRNGLMPLETIGPVSGLAIEQLRARAQLLANVPILDLQGVLKWMRAFPNLEEVWLIAPNFVDHTSEDARAAVAHYVSEQKAKVVYFVREEDREPDGRFWKASRMLDVMLGPEERERIQSIGLSKSDLTWLHTDYAVANPRRRNEAAGFQYIRRKNEPTFALLVDDLALAELIHSVIRSVVRTGEYSLKDAFDYLGEARAAAKEEKRKDQAEIIGSEE